MLMFVNNWLSDPGFRNTSERYRVIAELYESLTGEGTVVRDFREVSMDTVNGIDALRGIVLGGSPDDYDSYDMRRFEGEYDVIRNCGLPVLGICAGHQIIGFACDVPVERGGQEQDFREVQVVRTDPIFAGLPDRLVVHEGHTWEVKELPEDFVLLASNETCKIQVMKHRDRAVYGVQFHPERFTDEHPHGRTIITNFLKACVG